jgi:hypothetical protein
MASKENKDEPRRGMSKTTMLLGAAGLFLFIVGVKRSLRPGEVPALAVERTPDPAPVEGDGSA